MSYYDVGLGRWHKYLSMRQASYLIHYTTMYDQTSSVFGDYRGRADCEWHVRRG